jgi:Ca2+-binding RTX toxin-like protein
MRRNKFNSLRRFERLEDRRLMAADIDLDNGVLTIEGTDNRDLIVIEANPQDADEILVTIKDASNNYAVLEQEDYDLDDVQEIVAYGFGERDSLLNYTDIRAQLYGGAGNDYLMSAGGSDLLDGGADNDQLIGGGGNDDLYGRAGNDIYGFYSPELGSDVIYEDPNVDTDSIEIAGGGFPVGFSLDLSITATQVVAPGHLTLTLSSATGIENVWGSRYDDTIRGNSRNNVIHAGTGNDTIYGKDGADTLYGDQGNDWLYGEGGNDDLFGGDNNDYLYGGADNDDLFGENGDDHLYGQAGLDNLYGGNDNDWLDGGYDQQKDRLTGGPGADTFVRHRRRYDFWFVDNEQELLDYDSAVDEVITRWW